MSREGDDGVSIVSDGKNLVTSLGPKRYRCKMHQQILRVWTYLGRLLVIGIPRFVPPAAAVTYRVDGVNNRSM